MPRPIKYTHCQESDCNRKHYARGKCQSCYMKWRREEKLRRTRSKSTVPPRYTERIVSTCCGKDCIEGKKHEYGIMYCTKCEEPCYWKKTYYKGRKKVQAPTTPQSSYKDWRGEERV